MNQARAEELVNTFLQNDHLDKEANTYNDVEIQELIFLIHHAKDLVTSQSHRSEVLNSKIQELHSVIKTKIMHADELYIAYDKQTNYPYLDAEGRVWLFSKKEYAASAEDYFLQQFVMLDMRRLNRNEVMSTIGLLHIMGLSTILMDNGEYYLELKRDELLPPMDWSNTPDIQIPVTNPDLQHAMILFFQTVNVRAQTANIQLLLQSLEMRMLDEILAARYLLPMKLVEQEASAPVEHGITTIKRGDRILTAVLDGENDSKWLPAFTDWYEFEKVYDKEQWSSLVATYEDLLAVSGNMTGIVINPRGLGLRIDSNNQAKVEQYRSERSEASSIPSTEAPDPDNQPVLLITPNEVPMPMIESLKAYMKTQKDIQKAYLRQKIRGSAYSYLLIADTMGSIDDIHSGIAAAAAPHLEGISLDIIGMDTWQEDEKDIEPFYKKKRFGLF